MKDIYVLVNKETNDFWKKPRTGWRNGPARVVQAYVSEAKAWSALDQFHPKPDPSTVTVKKFVVSE